MEFPRDRLYSEYHLWVRMEKNHAVIGITEYARDELGAIDYVELPQEDDKIVRNSPFGIIETSKAVTDLMAPISGTVADINASLVEYPDAIANDPYGVGWLIRVAPSDPTELDGLLKPDAYEDLIKSQSEE